MKSNPDRAHEKLWPELEREFWQRMAYDAPNPKLQSLYLRERELVGVPKERRAELKGQFVFAGVKGVTMACPTCLKVFKDIHPTEPAWCPCVFPPTRLLPPQQISAVMDSTLKFFLNSGKFQ
jgi:hypothetical protein